MADVNIGELVTVTLRRRSRKVADNMSNHIPFLKRMKDRGNVFDFEGDGGRVLTVPLEHAEGNYQRYKGYEPLVVEQESVFDASEYEPVQAAVPVAISGREERMNASSARAVHLIKKRIGNAERTMMNNIATDLMSDGTLTNQITGIQAQVSKTPTSGTVGGIDRATYSFWRNKVRDVTDLYTSYDSDGVRRTMNRLWLDQTRNADQPDLVICDDAWYELYENGLQTLQRYASERDAAAGFMTLKYKSADVVYDSTVPANTAYMLNTNYLSFVSYQGANFEPLTSRRPHNQDAMVQFMVWMGNLAMSNAALQGVGKQ